MSSFISLYLPVYPESQQPYRWKSVTNLPSGHDMTDTGHQSPARHGPSVLIVRTPSGPCRVPTFRPHHARPPAAAPRGASCMYGESHGESGNQRHKRQVSVLQLLFFPSDDSSRPVLTFTAPALTEGEYYRIS